MIHFQPSEECAVLAVVDRLQVTITMNPLVQASENIYRYVITHIDTDIDTHM